MALPDSPQTREEEYLAHAATGGGTIPEYPVTREEMYLNKIATGDGAVPDVPLTRKEMYLAEIAENGGGGGETVLINNKNISANGEYSASSDSADGYKKVTVSVPNTYAAGDEGKVVSSGQLVAQTAHAQVTQNGTIDTTLNNSVEVAVSGGKLLPDEYQRVEYIENTNTALINTGWKRKGSLSIEIEASFTGGQSQVGILLGFSENVANWFGITSNNEVGVGLAAGTVLANTLYSNKNKYLVTFSDSATSVVCGEDSATRSGSASSSLYLCIFANEAKSYNCKAKVYSVKISDSNTLIRMLIPCYNTNTNAIGLYDVINGTFYGNANNSGNFTKGSDVLTDAETLEILLGGGEA